MKKLPVFAIVFALLVGCARVQVKDNVYDSMGGQQFKIDPAFHYVGPVVGFYEPPCITGDCANKKQTVASNSEVFVHSNDGKHVLEVLVLSKETLSGNNRWVEPKGQGSLDLAGKIFAASIERSSQTIYCSGHVIHFLQTQGYDVPMNLNIPFLMLTRKLNDRILGRIIYACTESQIPPVRQQLPVFLSRVGNAVTSAH